jgi:hypothetical protein
MDLLSARTSRCERDGDGMTTGAPAGAAQERAGIKEAAGCSPIETGSIVRE